MKLNINNIILFIQDWSGLIGLRILVDYQYKFSGVVASNTFLPVGSGSNEAFNKWKIYAKNKKDLNISNIIKSGL